MSDVTRGVVQDLMEVGLKKGSVQTDFGLAVVRSALLNGIGVLTVTFPDVEEKWVVKEEEAIAVKFVPIAEISPPLPVKVKVEGEERKKITLVQRFPFLSPLTYNNANIKPKKKVEGEEHKKITTHFPGSNIPVDLKPKKKEEKVETIRTKATKAKEPKTERPRTKEGKEKARTGSVKEQPPTKRARMGRPVDPKAKGAAVAVKKAPGSGKVTGIKLTIGKKPHGKQGKVAKIGPKVPVWGRQLGWRGDPEKIDINLFPHKIVCVTCGQPRYVDARNMAIKDHPVTLCRPCQWKHKQREHDRKIRERKIAAKEAVFKAERGAARTAKQSTKK